MKNNYTIFQTVVDLSMLKSYLKFNIIPISVYVDKNDKLSNKFDELYSLEWFDIGKKNNNLFYAINGDKLNKLIKENKLKIKGIVFSNGNYKKIDHFYPINVEKNKKLEIRKKELKKNNSYNEKCLISYSTDLWLENEFFEFGQNSLSEQAIKIYKKENI